MFNSAEELLRADPYLAYAYSYPHKTAYRPLVEPIPLQTLWRNEKRDALSLYMHIPFCEMRCGFCNLFTQARPKEGLSHQYTQTLSRQAKHVRSALGEAQFSRFAIGGGTPTQLETTDLAHLFALAHDLFGIDLRKVPSSVETSPETATEEKVSLLKENHVTRVSIGVQSFFEAETKSIQRPQKRSEVYAALERIKSKNFPTLNIDLMYGLPGQTMQTWLESIQEALRFSPQELYLYPLYVRPLTGMDKHQVQSERAAHKLKLYHAAREFLLSNGFEQISMRMFRARNAPDIHGPVYHCQVDGMIGLGCGARSYSSALHYSEEYAVGKDEVREIIESYLARDEDSFDFASYGFALNLDEQKRRFVILSLLQDGVSFSDYALRFSSSLLHDFPQVKELVGVGLATQTETEISLTTDGVSRADLIGGWLFSPEVWRLMNEYEMR